ncbi:MAG TPA: hypothetical protein QF564_24685 [Pirellulaceae bacterium]|nr:hypothetical protein [Pirellulaceae bacterium]
MNTSHPLQTRTICRLVVFALLAWMTSAAAIATDREAAKQVREGVRLHQAGDFEQAAEAFSKAAETLPANPRVAFNRGCALAAQGKHDEAELLLREAALARDSALAAAAFYNLGCLAGDQMKTLFGDQPEEAVGETRENGLLLVRAAVDHYRNVLRVNTEHAAARRNLELLRIWSKHIQDRWAQRDRERRREKMNLLEFLAWLQAEQRQTRAMAKGLPGKLDSPTLRQTARKLAATQRALTLEIEPLKVKLDEALQPPPDPAAQPPATSAPNAPKPALSPEMLQARQALHGLADHAGQSMSHAADELANRNVSSAIVEQTEVLPPLNQLFELVAPFEAILSAAIKSETALIETSTQATAGGSAGTTGGTRSDFEEAAEDQRFVSGWSRMLIRKAEQLLAEAESAGDVVSGGVRPTDISPTEIPLPTAETDVTPAAPSDAAADSSQTATSTSGGDSAPPPADPKAAYRKAIELGPRIENLTSEAAADLQQQAWSEALPKQEEALELLQEIAELLPPQEQENEDQEQQDQENQDEQDKEDQEKDGEQDKPSDDEQKKKQDHDQKDSKQEDDADKKKSNEEREKSKKEQGQPQEKLSRQQAESLLRQVREREREHREIEKEIRRLLQSHIFVEKDW